jgi:hydroxymethylbilane synthase
MGRMWRLGTRGSALAVAQSQIVADALEAVSGDRVELVRISTRGDQITDRPLAQVGGKGLFTKELELALLDGQVDLAVHSMKDMPSDQPDGLVIAAVPEREDPRDVLIGSTLADLRHGAVVGTGSARRRMQLLALRPDLELRDLRGNVDTRVLKQREGRYDAIVLAAAGLARLGRSGDVTEALSVEQMVPAAGQGALALQCREDREEIRELLGRLGDWESEVAVGAERAFMVALHGGCSVPAACHAWVTPDGMVEMLGFFGADDGRWAVERGRWTSSEVVQAGAAMGGRLGEKVFG